MYNTAAPPAAPGAGRPAPPPGRGSGPGRVCPVSRGEAVPVAWDWESAHESAESPPDCRHNSYIRTAVGSDGRPGGAPYFMKLCAHVCVLCARGRAMSDVARPGLV